MGADSCYSNSPVETIAGWGRMVEVASGNFWMYFGGRVNGI